MKFTLKTLIGVISLCAFLCCCFRYAFIVPNIAAERGIRTSPVQALVDDRGKGRKWSDMITYSAGQYLVTEFGSIRFAIRGAHYPGRRTSSVCLANDLTTGGFGSGTASMSSGLSISAWVIPGGSTCEFNGIPFQIIKGKLLLDGQEFDALKTPTLIIVDKKGHIESVEKIGSPDQ